MSSRLERLVALVLLLLLVAAGARAEANVGRRESGGSHAGEPEGIGAIAIAREDLVIDLRPLGAGGLVAVAATYHLDNPSDEKHLDLVFANASMTRIFKVTLDGRPVPTELVRVRTCPRAGALHPRPRCSTVATSPTSSAMS